MKILLRYFTALTALALAGLRAQTTTTGATFGTIVPLGATPSDLVLDEPRGQIYLVNTAANRIDILNTATNTIAGSIPVGTGPLSAAMSMDNNFLYVTNGTSLTLSVINLQMMAVTQTVTLPATPQGVEVGADGRALVSTVGTGTSTAAVNTLLIYDQTQPTGSPNQLIAVATPPTPTTPSPLPSQTLAKPDTTFTGKLVRTPNGQYIVGLTNPATNVCTGSTAATGCTYLFVYEVSSGTILRSRNVNGQSTVLSMSPDGSRFMAGYTLYDVATLSVLAQMNNANAPFTYSATYSVRQNIGGSVFSNDGKTIYGAFNVAAFTTPPPPSNSSTLMLSDSTSLGIQLGIKLPESIVAKMVSTADGTKIWCLSQSGIVYLPISTLYTYPILQPSATQVFLSQNPCNPGLVQGTVQMTNAGAGKLTFAVTTLSPTLTTSVTSGVAPATITFTMEPGRVTTYTRLPGTNLVSSTTTGVTLSGQSLDITVASPQAINVPPLIRVYMNYRQSDQRGLIFPVPVTPNNSPNVTQINTTASSIAGDQGLEDIVLDQPRNRVYISNAGYNRIEIFDTVNQVFLTPIPVNQMPHQLALSTDGNTLYVASNGGELIDMVNLTIGTDVGHVSLPAIPRQAGGQTGAVYYPMAMAIGSEGLNFISSSGAQWKVIGGTAIPRPANTAVIPTTLPVPINMLASPDNSTIVTLAGTTSGTAYLYQASTDSYIASNALFTTPIQSFFGPMAIGPGEGWYTLGGLYTNGSLVQLGGVALPSSSTGAQRNVVATAPFDANSYLRLSTPVRTNLTTTPTSDARAILERVSIATGTATLLAVAPDNPRFTLLGTARYNIPARSMVIDSNYVAYIIGLSGLSVVPLTPNGAATPAIATSAKAIVNASDGTTTLKIGSIINIGGSNLATTATASAVPPPTVLGGSCVTFNDVALPLLSTSAGQIQAQIPTTVTTGSNEVQVRSLGTGLQSTSVLVTVQAPNGGGSGVNGGSIAIDQVGTKNKILPELKK